MTPRKPPGTYDKCGGKKRQGEGLCTRPAGWGTDHPGIGRCKLHFGAAPSHSRAAQKVVARRECERLGLSVEVDPGEALIQELWETAGNVEFYRGLVQQLPAHPQPGKVQEVVGGEDDGATVRVPAQPGVYAPTYHVSGIATGEAKPHILVQLYNDERKHLTAVASAALKAGVEQRRVELAEAQAQQLAIVVSAIVTDLGHDLTDPGTREIVRLRLLQGGRAAA